ncbi:peptidoglycan DD-metalloendopeptidase family protein [Nocardioides sp. LMS-CY]|uniref:M23 family metallopeptidase n=1 Tax=Nocardioides sp. (strain LMS-CY) TaxID=2840457 RepID=UPI001BFFDDE0|nr:peptidoglycan DD-metalloendopeptidase family protein [Nocardioides sp. LMS-CY]QWF24002.1 peptidoglycan DD-metalloendopeptidase family protein [Nocardioides sp. LMS-CY]
MTPRHRLRTLLGPLLAMAVAGPAAPAAGETDPVGVWPLSPEPAVVRAFDPPADPWDTGHRGVDLRGHPGQRVRSALAGRVTWAGVLAGRGVVVVGHGTTRTTYEPVTATVAVGDRVAAGDLIGALSPVGSHCAPGSCLHWGWLEGETYLDPLRLVGAGPVRLLPLWRDDPAGSPGPAVTEPWQPPSLPYAHWRPLLRLLHLVRMA